MYKDFIKKNYKILLDILNCLKVGVYITDGDGNTVFLNDESCKTGGLTREEVLGKNMAELEEMGFVENSVTLRTLESGKEEDNTEPRRRRQGVRDRHPSLLRR